MSHVTSEQHLFTTEQEMNEATTGASDALLTALQREHPQIVRHLQDQSAANRKAS
jgi:hypothetical protein